MSATCVVPANCLEHTQTIAHSVIYCFCLCQAHCHALSTLTGIADESLEAVTKTFKGELKQLADLETVRKTHMVRLENNLLTKTDQNHLVTMTAVYLEALHVQYTFVIDLLAPVSAKAVSTVHRHLMYLKETTTVAQIQKYGITEISKLPTILREKWVSQLKSHFSDAALDASEILIKDKKEKQATDAALARDAQLHAENRQLMSQLIASNTAAAASRKRPVSGGPALEEGPKKAKSLNSHCRKENLCIKYVRANLSPALPVDRPCPGQDACKFNHAMPSEEYLTSVGLKSAL